MPGKHTHIELVRHRRRARIEWMQVGFGMAATALVVSAAWSILWWLS